MAAIALCKAAGSYKEDVAHFSTYAFYCMWSFISNYNKLQNNGKRIPKTELLYYEEEMQNNHDSSKHETYLSIIPSKENVEKTVLINEVLRDLEKYKDTISDKNRTVLEMLGEGYSKVEIASKLGCAPSLVTYFQQQAKRFVLGHGEFHHSHKLKQICN